MLYDDINDMKRHGFCGFHIVRELMESRCATIPRQMGVYFVLYDGGRPSFRRNSVGGHFKGQDPTVLTRELEENWVDDTLVVYVGKAGGTDEETTLHTRIKLYMDFGEGKRVAHRGGRYIWQLENNRDLVVCYKTLSSSDPEPRVYERRLIQDFESHYGKRPFANLRG